jgi:hypothetical protein
MAKKETSPEAPVVTTLPLPNSDNAMVIDLPDGQKLVVGKMATGTVIEVATWRGTGRPDSRTTRLMLGVSSQETVAAHAAEQGGAPAAPTKQQPIDIAKAYIAQALKVLSGLTGKVKKLKIEKPSTSPTLAAPEPVVSIEAKADDDVQAWLDSIIAKSEKKAAAQGTIKPAAKKAAPRKATVKKAATTRRSR